MTDRKLTQQGNEVLLKVRNGKPRMVKSATRYLAAPTKKVKRHPKSAGPKGRSFSPCSARSSITNLDEKGFYNPLLSRSKTNLNRRTSGVTSGLSNAWELTDFDSDYDFEEEEGAAEEERRALSRESLEHTYKRMCKALGVTPVQKYIRQIKGPTVNLRNCQLTMNDLKAVCVSLLQSVDITSLDVSGNDLGPQGSSYLAETISENVSITELGLADCNIGTEGLEYISEILLDMKPMTKLNLSGNKLTASHAPKLAMVIEDNDYIEELNLSNNELDSLGGTILGPAIARNYGIKKLNLSWNHLRLEGAGAICKALAVNTTLVELDLSWNGLSEEGCRALGAVLPENKHLKLLDLCCNRISIVALKYLMKGLEKNETLSCLKLDKNPLTTDGAILLMTGLTASDKIRLTNVHIEDIPVTEEFTDALDELQAKHKNIKVHHKEINKKRISSILKEKTLDDYDPAMILFEYMRQENLRLIDLFRTFDTDSSHSISQKELQDGFQTLNMPLSNKAVESLFKKLDQNENMEIEFDEMKIGQRKTVPRLRGCDVEPGTVQFEKNIEQVQEIRELIKKALKDRREKVVEEAKEKLRKQPSLSLIFKLQRKL